MGANDFENNKAPLFGRNTRKINTSMSAAPKLALVPLLLRCNLVIPQCICQVSLGLKEVHMGAHDVEYNKVPFLLEKTGNINTSMSAAPELALVPASRYYCDVTRSYHNVYAKFH